MHLYIYTYLYIHLCNFLHGELSYCVAFSFLLGGLP